MSECEDCQPDNDLLVSAACCLLDTVRCIMDECGLCPIDRCIIDDCPPDFHQINPKTGGKYCCPTLAVQIGTPQAKNDKNCGDCRMTVDLELWVVRCRARLEDNGKEIMLPNKSAGRLCGPPDPAEGGCNCANPNGACCGNYQSELRKRMQDRLVLARNLAKGYACKCPTECGDRGCGGKARLVGQRPYCQGSCAGTQFTLRVDL